MTFTKQKSTRVSQEDRRVVRTRQKLDSAFVSLLDHRSYANIRVSDIVRKARVGRATYYAHYSSKSDLLRSQFRRIVAPGLVANSGHACPIDATALLIHVRAVPRIYKSLMDGQIGSRILRESLAQRTAQLLAPRPGIARAVLARFVSSALLTVIEYWVETGAQEPPETIQTMFSNLVGHGLDAYQAPATIGGGEG